MFQRVHFYSWRVKYLNFKDLWSHCRFFEGVLLRRCYMSIFQPRKPAGKPVENAFKLGMNEFFFSKVKLFRRYTRETYIQNGGNKNENKKIFIVKKCFSFNWSIMFPIKWNNALYSTLSKTYKRYYCNVLSKNVPPGIKTSWRRCSDVSLYVPVTS